MTDEKHVEVTEPTQTTRAKKPFPLGGIIAIAVVIAIIMGVVGFASGVQFQKLAARNGAGNQTTGTSNRPGFGGRGDVNRNGSFGEVTGISDTSITIATRQRFNASSDSSTSTTKTYTINSSTAITIDGTTSKASDIKTGDTVMIEASSSDSSVASSIRVGMGGMGAPGQQQSADNSTDTTVRTN